MQTMTPTGKHQPVFWCGSRLTSGWAWLITIAVVLGSARGMIVIHADISPSVVYLASAVLLLSLAAFGIFKSAAFHGEWRSLKALMAINLALGTLHASIDWMLEQAFDPASLYLYLAPYIVFLFIRMPTYHFRVAVVLITLATGLSVVDNFVETVTNPYGYDAVVEYNMKLRPDVYQSQSLSRTGDFFRVGGYTGSYHDSANILGMAVVFFFINFILSRKSVDFGMLMLAAVSMTLTQSASNIVVAIFTACVFSAYLLVRRGRTSIYVYFLLALLSIVGLSFYFGEVMSIFLARIGPDGDWDGMLSQLNFDSLVSVAHYAWLGRVSGFSTEVALINLIFKLGLVPALILFGLMCYPFYLYCKIRPPCLDALPALAAIFFGFVSLLHYGSIFRVTSIFMFYSFYAAALVILMNHRYRQSDRMTWLPGAGTAG